VELRAKFRIMHSTFHNYAHSFYRLWVNHELIMHTIYQAIYYTAHT